MKFLNLWNSKEANRFKNFYSKRSISKDLALRVYSSRLIGSNHDLVMHGGGNTSCKSTKKDIFGNSIDILCVKGSGWNLEFIEPEGFAETKLDSILELEHLDSLSDNDMIMLQKQSLVNSNSPNPSVETLLHGFIPHKFVDHTHASPFLGCANLADIKKINEEIFENKIILVPYVMPGFKLAKLASKLLKKNGSAEGLLLAIMVILPGVTQLKNRMIESLITQTLLKNG